MDDEGDEVEIVELPLELESSQGAITAGTVTLMTGHDLLMVLGIEIDDAV